MALAAVALQAAPARAGAEECVYVIENVQSELLVLQGNETRRIAIDALLHTEIALADDAAYVDTYNFLDPGTVIEIDLLAGMTARSLPVGRGNSDIEHANGKLYVPNSDDRTVSVIDIATGATRTLTVPGYPSRVVASADGKAILVGSGYAVYFLDAETDEIIDEVSVPAGFYRLAVDGSMIFLTGEGTLTALEERPNGGYEVAWSVSGVGFSHALEVGGRGPRRRVFSARWLEFGAPLAAVDLAPPHAVEHLYFAPGPGVELWLESLAAGAEHLYATGPEGLYTLNYESGELDVIRESLFFSGVRVGPCAGTPLPTQTPTPTPTPSENEPTGADECIYVTDDADDSLTILRGEWSYSIPLGRRLPKGIVIQGAVAYVNHAEFESELPPQRISVVDLPRKTVVGSHLVDPYSSSSVAHAGGRLYVASEQGVRTIDLASGAHARLAGPWSLPLRVAASPDERHLYVGDGDRFGRVYVVDVEDGGIILDSFGSGKYLTQLAAYEGGLVEARDKLLRHYERTEGGYAQTWKVADVGFSQALVVVGGRVFSGAMFVSLPGPDRVPLVDVPLEPPHNVTVHSFEAHNLSALKGVDVDAAGEYLYAIGRRGLYRFSLATAKVELLRESKTLSRLRLAPCPGEPGPTWTVTPTPTASATLAPTASRTPPPRTPTPTPGGATPTQRSTFPGDADCDGMLGPADVEAAMAAMFDPRARSLCDADCNRDGHVSVADVDCTARALAAR